MKKKKEILYFQNGMFLPEVLLVTILLEERG